MADIFGQTLDPTKANAPVTTHLSRRAEVILVKRAKNFPEPGTTGESEATEARRKYAEFLQLGIMSPARALEARDPDPDGAPFPRYSYWQITANSVSVPAKVNGTTQLLPNADVESVNVTNSTRDISSARVTLRNAQDKYIFKKHPMYVGQSLFESDDFIYINLPDTTGKLVRTFTGLITTVRQSSSVGDTINNTITIEALDLLKRLKESRSNTRPSLNILEANGAQTVAYDFSFGTMLPHQILATIFARAYCDLSSVPGFFSKLNAIRNLATSNPQKAVRDEEELRQKYTVLPSGTSTSPLATDSSLFLITKGTLTTQGGRALVAGANLPTTKTVPKDTPRQIFGFRQARRTLTSNELSVSAVSPVSASMPADDLVFAIEGTVQPVYNVSFGNFGLDRWISEWQSAYSIAKKITDDLDFELNCTAEGVVRVRPLNTLLPADLKTPVFSPQVPANQKPRVGYEYWLQKPLIKDENYVDTDEGVVTIAYVLGRYQFSSLNQGLEFLKAGVAVDAFRLAKLGARMAPQQTRLELLSAEACQAFARAYLTRLNMKARTGTVVYTGDARLQSGNPVYIPHKNRIYYIDTISHDFKAGGAYTVTLTLTYGRVPIAVTDEKAAQLTATMAGAPSLAADIKSRYTFAAVLTRLVQQQQIDATTKLFASTTTEVERYKKYGPDITTQTLGAVTGGNSQLVFNGYVWEDIPEMTYEDLFDDFNVTNTALALSNLQLSQRLDSAAWKEQVSALMRIGNVRADSVASSTLLKANATKIVANKGIV